MNNTATKGEGSKQNFARKKKRKFTGNIHTRRQNQSTPDLQTPNTTPNSCSASARKLAPFIKKKDCR